MEILGMEESKLVLYGILALTILENLFQIYISTRQVSEILVYDMTSM